MGSMILSLDPSIRATGWALVSDTGRVIQSGTDRAAAADSSKRLLRLARNATTLWTDVVQVRLGAGRLIVAVERATMPTRASRYTDSWGPGLAAGVYLGVVAAGARTCVPVEVLVSDWRRAMLGTSRGGREALKALAVRRAAAELADAGLVWGGTVATRDDEADAICLGVYVARTSR